MADKIRKPPDAMDFRSPFDQNRMTFAGLICLSICLIAADEPKNLNTIVPDLVVPALAQGEPAPGRRVESVTAGWEKTAVRHTVYLPRDWRAGKKYPVLIEFPGNGGYRNALGDVSDGSPGGCVLGYGLSGGEGFLWVALPFVEKSPDGSKRNALTWWGDVEESKRYCEATVRDVCTRYGGDPERVVLCGFSRGAIACGYIGLNDDRIASLWRAFFCHSHYDGVRRWPYAASDAASARVRLGRLKGRPQWISHETDVAPTRRFLAESGIEAPFRFVSIPYPNHSAAWVLRDLPERRLAREWLHDAVRRDTPP